MASLQTPEVSEGFRKDEEVCACFGTNRGCLRRFWDQQRMFARVLGPTEDICAGLGTNRGCLRAFRGVLCGRHTSLVENSAYIETATISPRKELTGCNSTLYIPPITGSFRMKPSGLESPEHVIFDQPVWRCAKRLHNETMAFTR